MPIRYKTGTVAPFVLSLPWINLRFVKRFQRIDRERPTFADMRKPTANNSATWLTLHRFRGKGMPRHAHEKFEADKHHKMEKRPRFRVDRKVFPDLHFDNCRCCFWSCELYCANDDSHSVQHTFGYWLYLALWRASSEWNRHQPSYGAAIPAFVDR